MRGSVVLLGALVLARAAVAQQETPAAPESARVESTPVAPLESPAQMHYRQGLRTVGRGIAQLKDGLDHVASAGRDSARLRQAGQRLAGLCGAADGFLARGRVRMVPTAYEDSTGIKARRLTMQIDSLVRFIPTCEAAAAKQPVTTAGTLLTKIKGYDSALHDYRAAIGLPNH